jgi:hypothetical protein
MAEGAEGTSSLAVDNPIEVNPWFWYCICAFFARSEAILYEVNG